MSRGFTLIELLAALLTFSLLALMSYHGLGAVLSTRDHVGRETEKWRAVASFLGRFEHDVRLAAPRPVRSVADTAAAWVGSPDGQKGSLLEFSRFASAEGVDSARRVAYRLNRDQEIELLVWPGLDVAPAAVAERYALLTGVEAFELGYVRPDLTWTNAWPGPGGGSPIPRAVRVRIVLGSGEEIIRVFALR